MKQQVNYEEFKYALEEQKSLNFSKLKSDIKKVKCFVEKLLDIAMSSSQTTVERDYHVSSL